MEQKTPYKTHGRIIQRVPKTDANKYGVKTVRHVPVSTPAVVIFGGELTDTIKDANYYASLMSKLLKFYNINGVNIYSVYYDFDTDDRSSERIAAFIKARSKLLNKMKQPEKIQDTSYIQQLYNIVVRPRIIGHSGEKLDDNRALRNVRNLIIFTHSHGSAPVRAFQDIMLKDMRDAGYERTTIRNIMKNIFVVQHAPMSPLEKSQFNTVSFMSADDTQMDFHNKFSEYLFKQNADLWPSYFSLGNLFAVYSITEESFAEHSIVGLLPNIDQEKLTADGAIIMAAERNSIINGIRATQGKQPIPPVRDLITNASSKDPITPDFDLLKRCGDFFMRVMENDLRTTKNTSR